MDELINELKELSVNNFPNDKVYDLLENSHLASEDIEDYIQFSEKKYNISFKDALKQAGNKSQSSILASDAFIPFPDTIELANQGNISCIIQPGGAIRDKEVIEKANELEIKMIFTGVRHFRH